MALTIGQKCVRVLKFLRGLRIHRTAGALAAHGFDQADFDEGWTLLRAAGGSRLNVPAVVQLQSDVYDQLDELENVWFPICQASLTRNYPEVADAVFLNLRQTNGLEVSLSVGAFVERIRKLETSKRSMDQQARSLLERRGLKEEVVAQMEALLQQLRTKPEAPPAVEPSPEDLQRAERAMWSWYLEWSVIARKAIHDRRLLRSLGFITASGAPVLEDEATPEDIVDAPDEAPVSLSRTKGAAE